MEKRIERLNSIDTVVDDALTTQVTDGSTIADFDSDNVLRSGATAIFKTCIDTHFQALLTIDTEPEVGLRLRNDHTGVSIEPFIDDPDSNTAVVSVTGQLAQILRGEQAQGVESE